MKHILLIISILIGLTCHAQVETYTLNVGDFSKLKVGKSINVDYRCSSDSAGHAVFTAPAEIVTAISLTNSDGTLKVDFDNDAPKGTIPTLTVYSNYLQSVENSGDSTVRVLSVLPCPSFQATLVGNGRIVVRDIKATRVNAKISTGNGTIVITGTADEAKFNMVGTGTIQADGLKAQAVKVSAYGTGSVGCWPVETLTVHGMGSTKVYYRGSPTVKNKAAGVKVEKL